MEVSRSPLESFPSMKSLQNPPNCLAICLTVPGWDDILVLPLTRP